MKTKVLLATMALFAGLSMATTASADTTRDQIEQEGNERLSQIWQQYQDAENFKSQYQGDHYDEAWQNADAKARALLFEYEQAGTQLSDELHNYDVSQWQPAQQSSQPASQTSSQQSVKPIAAQAKTNTVINPAQPAKTTEPTAKLTAVSQQPKQAEQIANQTPQQSHSEITTTQSDNLSSQSQNSVQAKSAASNQGQLPQTGNAVSWLAPLIGMFGLGLAVKGAKYNG